MAFCHTYFLSERILESAPLGIETLLSKEFSCSVDLRKEATAFLGVLVKGEEVPSVISNQLFLMYLFSKKEEAVPGELGVLLTTLCFCRKKFVYKKW